MPKYRAHWAQRASGMYVSHPLRRIGEKIQMEIGKSGLNVASAFLLFVYSSLD